MSSTNAANVGNDVESKLTSDVEKVRLDDRGVAVPPASKPQPAPISRTVRTPIVLERAVTGRVKWFDFQKGYGFITRDDGRDDVFVHASAIVRKINCGLVLIEGQKVEFDIIDGFKGREATTVSGPGGMRVGNVLQYMSQSQQQKQRGGNPNRIGGYNGGIRAPIQQRNGNQQRYSASGEGKMHRGPFNARSRPSYDNNRNSTGNGHRFSNNTNGDAGSKGEKDTIEEVAEKREKGSNA